MFTIFFIVSIVLTVSIGCWYWIKDRQKEEHIWRLEKRVECLEAKNDD